MDALICMEMKSFRNFKNLSKFSRRSNENLQCYFNGGYCYSSVKNQELLSSIGKRLRQ